MAKRAKKQKLSDQLRLLIKQSELSRYEISRRSRVDGSQLHRFLNGTGSLKTDSSLDAVCEVLGLVLREEK